jgi:hypothetical protein
VVVAQQAAQGQQQRGFTAADRATDADGEGALLEVAFEGGIAAENSPGLPGSLACEGSCGM